MVARASDSTSAASRSSSSDALVDFTPVCSCERIVSRFFLVVQQRIEATASFYRRNSTLR